MPRKKASPEEQRARAVEKLEGILICWQCDLAVPAKLSLTGPELAILRGLLAQVRAGQPPPFGDPRQMRL
jgi:hypothetical protein